MSAFTHIDHIAGPAIVTFNSQAWYSEADIDVDIVQEEFEVRSSRYGIVDKRIRSLPVGTISFKPDGQVTAGRATKAFPYGLSNVGASIFGAADVPLYIDSVAGKRYTFKRAALSQSPGLLLSAVNTAFDGNLQFLCLHGMGLDPITADAFLNIAAHTFDDATFDETKIITPGFSAAYGAGYTAIESLTGFRIALPLAISRKSVDRYGVIDAFLTGIGPATCNFTPAGMTEAAWLTLSQLDGANLKLPGVSGSSGSTDLIISGTGLTVTLPKANVTADKLAYGTDKERLGELIFHNRAVFTAGVPGSLLTITVA